MKVVKITLGGTVTAGDAVIVHYSAPRGGRTSAGHFIAERRFSGVDGSPLNEPESLETIARGLAGAIQTYFCKGEFQAEADGHVVTVICSDLVSDVVFSTEVQGAGTETVTLG